MFFVSNNNFLMRTSQRNYCLSQELIHNCTFPEKLVHFCCIGCEINGNKQDFPFSVEFVAHLEQVCR